MKYFLIVAVAISAVFSGPLATNEPCPMICPMNYAPICGSDGKTYGNLCSLKSISCLRGEEITVVFSGPCKNVIIPPL